MSSESDKFRQHDFRRLYPRHVMDLAQTGPEDRLGYVCCDCGLGPGYMMKRGRRGRIWRSVYRDYAGAFLEWPDDKRITNFEIDTSKRTPLLFCRVEFEER